MSAPADAPTSAKAVLSELQALLDRRASLEEVEAWTRLQESRLNTTGSAGSRKPASSLPVVASTASPLAPIKTASRPRAESDLPNSAVPAVAAASVTRSAPTTPPTHTGLPVALSTSRGTSSTLTAPSTTLPPIVEPTAQRRAEVENVLGELFSRAGPGGGADGIRRKPPSTRPLPMSVEGISTPVPPPAGSGKSASSFFSRRGLATASSTTKSSSKTTLGAPAAVSVASTGPLQHEDIDDAPLRIRGMGGSVKDPLPRQPHELPQVLHVGEIAALIDGSSSRSVAADSSDTGAASSALLGLMNEGSSLHGDSRSNSSVNGLHDQAAGSCVSDAQHAACPGRQGTNGVRAGRSVLNVSDYLTAEENPILNGALPPFGAEEGPHFARTAFNRRMPVYVSIDETKAALAAINVPVIDDILNAVHDVDIVAYTREHGLDNLFPYVCLNVLLRYGFVKRLGLNVPKLYAFLKTASTFFREGNPFHHPFHASDVVISAHQWLAQPTAAGYLSDMELFAFLFAAAIMRVGHCGADNDFLAQMHHPFATVFGYSAPQQGATLALVVALLDQPANHFLPPLTMRTAVLAPQKADTPFGAQASDTETSLTDDTAKEQNPHWTPSVELEFLDMVSDLVLASDERNHTEHVATMAHIAAEHFLFHGCVCSDRSAEERAAVTTPCSRCCAYIEDKDVPQLLKALLHFIDFCFLFRPYPIFVSGACMHTAELYRQASYRSKLIDTINRVLAAPGDSEDAAAAAAAVAAVTVTGHTRMSDDRNAQSAPWRPAMTRTSIIATLESRRRRGDNRHSISSPLATTSTHSHTTDEDSHLSDCDDLFGPLRGYGRDICLVGLETLYYPNLAAIGPYLPSVWMETFFENHARMLEDNPSPAEYDAAIERVFRLGHRKTTLSAESAEAVAGGGNFYKTACYELVEECKLHVDPKWSLDADAAHVKRFFTEIMSPLKPTYL